MTGHLVFLLILGFLATVALVPTIYAWSNPIVNVVDELTSSTPYAVADTEVAQILGATRRLEFRMVLPGTYTLSYRHYPTYALVLGVLTFPLGLLLLFLVREILMLTVSVTEAGRGSRVTVVGRAHTKLALAVGETLSGRLATEARPAP